MFRKFDHRAGHHLLLSILWAILCLPNLGGPSLWDIDEGNNVECAREMLASGNYIIPTNNYQMREDKPALLYWLQIASARLLGVGEWAGRFPSAVAALLAVLALYEMGRQTFGVRAGLLAAVVLATSFSLLGAAHFANPDALLLAFTTLSLALFWHDFKSGGHGWLVGSAIASGLAVLAKGPVGVVLPLAVCLLFLAWQGQLRRLWDLRILSMVLAFLLVAAPWYVWVGVETKGAWVKGFWNHHNVDRALRPLENHSGSYLYYVLILLVGLAPWSIFLGPTILHTFRRLRQPESESGHEQAAVRFLISWCAVYFVFFSIVQTKLPNYILPAYPAVALLTAHLLERWRTGAFVVPVWMVRLSLVCLGLLGVGVTVGLLAVSGWMDVSALRGRTFPGLAAWAWLGAVWVLGAGLAWWLYQRDRKDGLIATIACSAVLFSVPVVGWGLEAVEPHKAARPLAQALPEDQTRRDVLVATYNYFQPSLVFYCRREVVRFTEEDQVHDLLKGQVPAFLFVPETVWNDLQSRLPAKMQVLARHHDLYSGRMIVLVSNE